MALQSHWEPQWQCFGKSQYAIPPGTHYCMHGRRKNAVAGSGIRRPQLHERDGFGGKKKMNQTVDRESAPDVRHREQPPHSLLPALPVTVRDTGLDQFLLVELIAKTLFVFGKVNLSGLAIRLKLSVNVLTEVLRFMLNEHLVEVPRRGMTDIDIEYQLTDAGKLRASEFMARCRYIGPAPVTLEAYRDMVARQSVRDNRVTQDDVAGAFAGMTLSPAVREQAGAAMNSGRPLFLYGPAGSGKTYLAERLGRLLHGPIAVPYAIVVDNEIIQVFDPLVHQALPVDVAPLSPERVDNRWQSCRRPIILTGGELTLDMLELRYDAATGFYQAPPHFKANNGIFIVDDLGRQRVAPKDLMNRWIVPMDRGCDHLSLHTGTKFTVPFDVLVVFSTNLQPAQLADESFLRRLGYKIHVGALGEDEYRSLFHQYADTLAIAYDEEAFRHLVDALHGMSRRPLLACYPRDLLGLVLDYARYRGEQPAMTRNSLALAWSAYFARHEGEVSSEPGTQRQTENSAGKRH